MYVSAGVYLLTELTHSDSRTRCSHLAGIGDTYAVTNLYHAERKKKKDGLSEKASHDIYR